MILLFSLLVPLVKAVATPTNESFADVQTHVNVTISQVNVVPVQVVNSSQTTEMADAKKDEVKKRSVITVKRKYFKGLVLHSTQWAAGLWPRGVVPYEILRGYNPRELWDIRSAMNAFRIYTCINFRPRTRADKYYLSIFGNYREGCYGDVGRQTSLYFRTYEGKFRTRMNMHSHCLNKPNMIHELMHTIGFHHEHQRVDRHPRFSNSPRHPDPRYEYWIRKTYSRSEAHYMGRYDSDSIMHYPVYGYKNYARTKFSASDIRNINILYRCPQAYRRYRR